MPPQYGNNNMGMGMPNNQQFGPGNNNMGMGMPNNQQFGPGNNNMAMGMPNRTVPDRAACSSNRRCGTEFDQLT